MVSTLDQKMNNFSRFPSKRSGAGRNDPLRFNSKFRLVSISVPVSVYIFSDIFSSRSGADKKVVASDDSEELKIPNTPVS